MKGIQTTTGLGFGSISTGVVNFLNLFGDTKIIDAWDKLGALNFNEVSTSLLLILAGIISMWYNEDKKDANL